MASQRKIDVFILIDISGSMFGEPIDSLNNAIENLVETLCANVLTIGAVRLCIHTYNEQVYEICKLELVESLCNLNSLGTANGPTHSGKALERMLSIIHETFQEHQDYRHAFKKPLLFHITDGFPSDITTYEEIVEKLNCEEINKIGCAIGASADLNSLKSFSNIVIALEKKDRDSIIQFSHLLAKIILISLYSDNDDLDYLEIFKPINPNDPILTGKIKIV
jgi:uncharacterized protein YegL